MNDHMCVIYQQSISKEAVFLGKNFKTTIFITFVSSFSFQWLVKRAIETREELGDKIRQYSINQFQKSHTLPKDEELKEKEFLSLDAIRTFKVGTVHYKYV